MARDPQARDPIARRTYLKLAGIGMFTTATASVGTESAAAADSIGYGGGRYGTIAYGGSTQDESVLEVSASDVTSLAQTEVTLHGNLTDLGGASSVTVHFEYRATDTSTWTATTSQSLATSQTFSKRVTGLTPATDYEFRVTATANDGGTVESSPTTFTTNHHTIVIDGTPSPTISNSYSVTVSGSLEKSSALGTINEYDTISGSTTTGRVLGGKDGYRFTGDVTDFTVDGNPDVYLDGEQVAPANLGDTTYPDTMVIDGSAAPRQLASYEATVSGKLVKSSALGSVNSYDTISGSTATGRIVGGKDGYRFTGDLTKLHVEGPVTVALSSHDGSTSSSDSLSNSFVVDGTNTPNQLATYSITVDGSLEKSSDRGSINEYDTISGGTVTGRVIGGKDGFRYSGNVTRIEISGPAVLRFTDSDG